MCSTPLQNGDLIYIISKYLCIHELESKLSPLTEETACFVKQRRLTRTVYQGCFSDWWMKDDWWDDIIDKQTNCAECLMIVEFLRMVRVKINK